MLYISPLPYCGIMICSKRPLIIHRLPYRSMPRPLRSEDIWRGKQQLIQEEPVTSKHRQAPCVSDQSRAKGTPATVAVVAP